MKSTIWLSYDLGVNGDYEGMYSWLDNHGAKECGSSTAFLKYHHNDDLLEALKVELSDAVTLNRRSRIYVIFTDNGHIKGRYLVGKPIFNTGVGDFGSLGGGGCAKVLISLS